MSGENGSGGDCTGGSDCDSGVGADGGGDLIVMTVVAVVVRMLVMVVVG